MPYRDGTGPWGDGRPGRGLGPCGRFAGFLGGGRGRRFRLRGYNQFDSLSPEVYPDDRQSLEAVKKDLEAKLAWLEKRLQQKD